MDKEKLKEIADIAKEAVKHLDEPYKSIAYKEFLEKMLSVEMPTKKPITVLQMVPEKDKKSSVTLPEIIDEKNPRSHTDIVMVFAYYLFKSGKREFTIEDILGCYKQVLIPSSTNPTDIVHVNIRKYLLNKEKRQKGEKQRYSITRKGVEYIDSLREV